MASQVINFKASDTLLDERTLYPAEVKKKKKGRKNLNFTGMSQILIEFYLH